MGKDLEAEAINAIQILVDETLDDNVTIVNMLNRVIDFAQNYVEMLSESDEYTCPDSYEVETSYEPDSSYED